MNISLIIPSYNCTHYLVDSLSSALNQNNKKFTEIIVVDDCSKESPVEFIKNIDHNVSIIRHDTNQGVGAARNTGAKHATGDYLVFLDADDILDINYLTKITDFIQDNQLSCAGCWLYYMTNPNNHGKILKIKPTINEKPMFPGSFPSGFIIKKTLYTDFSGFNTSIANSEDSEFFSRIYASGTPIFNLDEPLVGYRINPKSKTSISKERKMFFKDLLYLVYEKKLNIPISSFHDIYDMRSKNLPCPVEWEKNTDFRSIYNTIYPWKELIKLRTLYAMWLEKQYLTFIVNSLCFLVSNSSFVVKKLLN